MAKSRVSAFYGRSDEHGEGEHKDLIDGTHGSVLSEGVVLCRGRCGKYSKDG